MRVISLDISPFRPFLTKVLRRSRLGAAECEALLSLPGHPVQIGTNRDFVLLGQHLDHACLVVEGLVGRFGQNRDGNRQITALHIAGDMPDLHSVVVPQAGFALQALCVATIVKVPHSALRDVAYRFPAIAEAFWRECAVDAAILSEWVVNVGRRDAASRLAHLLCEIACRHAGARPGRQVDCDFPLTQQQLADMLGLTPVHVNRTLMALRRQGLVDLSRRRLRILDWAELSSLGDFDDAYLHLGELPEAPIRAEIRLVQPPALGPASA
jgi:CRP-like cAMP-binding protein